MVDITARTDLLRRRVAALAVGPEDMQRAARAIDEAGMRLPDAAATLHREWLNDMVASRDAAEYRAAARDPGGHFARWAAERARDRFRVTWRAVDAVAAWLGPDAAAKLALIVWPQEIAWAQRLRRSDNPYTATKAAMFLREAEGSPAKAFKALCEAWSDCMMTAGYGDSSAHDATPADIRFSEEVPEFSPLFLRYAARAYGEILSRTPRDRIEALAARACHDETVELRRIKSSAATERARRFPMRRMLPVMEAARGIGVSPNHVFVMEERYLLDLEEGAAETEASAMLPHVGFVTAMADGGSREALLARASLPDQEPTEVLWEVANIAPRWTAGLPRSWAERWPRAQLEKALPLWQADVVHEKREAPYDPVSDFGFFLLEQRR